MTPDARILRALRTASTIALPIQELATRAGLSPADLATHIAELRSLGYRIELHLPLGYRFIAAPDRLNANDLVALLGIPSHIPGNATGSLRLAREIVVVEETGSTNDLVAQMARAGAEEGLVIFAERQTAGRGRLGRRWESDAHKGLWFSLLLRPEFALANWSRLTTWVAVAISRGLEEALPGCKADIKWPNDVYLAGRKVVGILTETAIDPVGGGGFAVVGIGVNVNQVPEDFPEELAGRATSLRAEASVGYRNGPQHPGGTAAAPLDRQAVAVALLRQLDALYPCLANNFEPIVAEAESRSVLLGQWVEIHSATGAICGTAEALEPDGSLRVRCNDGQVIAVSGGEVTLAKRV